MFEVNNGVVNVNGSQGKYDEKTVTNPSVRYGRNAVDNYYSYLEQPLVNAPEDKPIDFSQGITEENLTELENAVQENDSYLRSLPPLEYEYRYMPNIQYNNIDKNAILGAAYEEMGQRKSISVEEFDKTILPDENFTSKGMDLNDDGNIDIGEYGLSIVAADILSKSDTPDANNMDGSINSKGFSAVYDYAKKSNLNAAIQMYSNLNNQLNLTDAVNDFNPEG